jgi:hypothetical protein
MATKKSTTKSRSKVGKVMHEYKHGQLKSGSGGKVKSRKQAIAIGLSEARAAGAKIPKKKATRKSATKKKAATKKKSTSKRKSASKSSSKKKS